MTDARERQRNVATNTNLKDATSFAARADNLLYVGGKTVGNAALARFSDALKTVYSYPGGGAWPVGRPDANDAASWFYKQAKDFVENAELGVARAAVQAPAEWEG